MTHTFQMGQIIQGERLVVFEVVCLDPLTVKCLEISGFWKDYGRKGPDGKWLSNAYGTEHYETWEEGMSYELVLGNPQTRNFNFKNHKLPWCSCYENGTFSHYR